MKQAVIDLGFGDSGKGITTSYLCSLYNPGETVVVRSNGGHQAGHTVVHQGFKHVFSQFGSGTLQGFRTYLSKNFTVYPASLLREHAYIRNYQPLLFIDPMAMVTTPWDIDYNRDLEKENQHGSVGIGFGQTIKRNQEHYNLYFQDIFYPSILKAKVQSIVENYYNLFITHEMNDINAFLDSCASLRKALWVDMKNWEEIQNMYENIIFESAQGILLDQHHGFFPNVTRSNTTTKNIMEMTELDEVFYVTRTYQTRHGNGFMTNEFDKPVLKNNEDETNKSHKFQGEFRTAAIDPNLLRYALQCDSNYINPGVKKNLVITCYDQLEVNINWLLLNLRENFSRVFISTSPDAKDFKQIR